jgi:hypothetical protein
MDEISGVDGRGWGGEGMRNGIGARGKKLTEARVFFGMGRR